MDVDGASANEAGVGNMEAGAGMDEVGAAVDEAGSDKVGIGEAGQGRSIGQRVRLAFLRFPCS